MSGGSDGTTVLPYIPPEMMQEPAWYDRPGVPQEVKDYWFRNWFRQPTVVTSLPSSFAQTKPNLVKGEVWFVKLPAGVAVVEAVITDVTGKTVELRATRFGAEVRYAISDVVFVERKSGGADASRLESE